MAAGRGSRVVTPERFATGLAFDQYMDYIGTPENLAREAGWWRGPERMDWTGPLRSWYETLRLRDDQVAAIRWLAAQPKGPAKILLISEEWSSDCRRVIAMLGRLAEAAPLELRIFPREYLYHYTERPALFPRDRLVPAMQAARPGETREQAWERFLRDWGAMQRSPFFKVWASAAIDEMLSALYEQRILGALPDPCRA